VSILLVHSTQYFTCIQPPGVGVATTAVCQHKGLHSSLSGLLWHVLDEVQPPLEAYHGLVNGNLPTKVVCSPEVVEQGVHKWPQLVQRVMPRLSLGNILGAVIEVEETKFQREPIPFQDAGEGGHGKGPFC